MKLFYKICIFGVMPALLLSCGDKEAPTEQVEYATVAGTVHYRYFSEVTLIEGAEVNIMDKVDTSDAKGKYAIEGIPYGEYEISCTHPDYDTFVVEVDMACDNYIYDIGMLKSKFTLTGQVLHTFDGAIEDAIVTLDSRVDTTDENGLFEFLKVSPGFHNIQCYHPDYDLFSSQVGVYESSANHIIIELNRQFWTYVDTSLVEEDATVKYEYYYYNCCGQVTLVDSNYGSAADVVIGGCYSFAPGSHGVGDECLIKRWRTLIKLPNVNTLHQNMIIDSAKLYLAIMQKWGVINNKMIIKRVIDDWDENTVTWNSMPDISDNQGLIELSDNDTVMVIDVTDNYKNEFGDHYGLIISNDYEESNCCCVGTFFWFYGGYDFASSENLDPHKRPYVVIYTRQ